MNLEGTCGTCGRRFALSQLWADAGGTAGRCPFCGTHFGRHYVAVLPDSVRDAETSANALIEALERLRDMRPGFEIDLDKLIREVSSMSAHESA